MSKAKKIIIILISIIFLSLIVFLIYNYIKVLKIMDIKEKIAQYKNTNSRYFEEDVTTNSDSSVMKMYLKDKKLHIDTKSKDKRILAYYENGLMQTYEEKDGKINFVNEYEPTINFESEGVPDPFNILDDKWQAFICSFKLKFSNVVEDDKECYKIESNSDLIYEKELYIDKETGLVVKSIEGEGDGKTIVKHKYEFDNVDDSVFERPKVEEKNQ